MRNDFIRSLLEKEEPMETMYKGSYMNVVKQNDYEFVDEADVVWIIPLSSDRKVAIRYERIPPHSLKENIFTIISGHIEKGERKTFTVERELKEEAGIIDPGSIELLREDVPVCKSTNMKTSIYLVKLDSSTQYEKPKGDGSESKDASFTLWVTLDELEDILENYKCDVSVNLLYFLMKNLLKGQGQHEENQEDS